MIYINIIYIIWKHTLPARALLVYSWPDPVGRERRWSDWMTGLIAVGLDSAQMGPTVEVDQWDCGIHWACSEREGAEVQQEVTSICYTEDQAGLNFLDSKKINKHDL